MNDHSPPASLSTTRPTPPPADPVRGGSPRWLFGSYDYPVSHRVLELGSLVVFVALGVALSARLAQPLTDRLAWTTAPLMIAALAVGLLAADLFSGIVHFLFDQYGSPQTPVIGRKFVAPFRDHHADPLAMTHGDFIGINSDNLLICLPVMGLTLALADVDAHPYTGLFVLALVAGAAMTNQIHKWAHMPAVPKSVQFAQRHGLILGVDHHDCHHRAPYDRHYCITFGRLDAVLDVVTTRLSPGSAGRTGRAHRHQPPCIEDRSGRQTDHHAT